MSMSGNIQRDNSGAYDYASLPEIRAGTPPTLRILDVRLCVTSSTANGWFVELAEQPRGRAFLTNRHAALLKEIQERPKRVCSFAMPVWLLEKIRPEIVPEDEVERCLMIQGETE